MLRRISLVFLLSVSLLARAETLGTGFEGNSIDGWSHSGTLAPTKNTWSSNGSGVALTTGVTNYSPGGGKTWTITPYGSHMVSIQPGTGSVTFDSAVTSLGLSATENTAIKNYLSAQASSGGGGNPTPTNASWIKRTFALQAGTTYTMAWQYLSTDYTPYNDGSMMTLAHATNSNITPNLNNSQQRYALLGFTNPGTGNYATGSYGATGWQVAQFTVPEAGNYTLGFAAFNLGDSSLSPILFVDIIQGTTLLNGASFGPVAPNEGSTAPPATPPPPPPPAYSSGITATQQDSKNAGTLLRQNQMGNEIDIEQIGDNNVITLRQGSTPSGKNRMKIYSSGDSNTLNLNQGYLTDGAVSAGDTNNHYLLLNNSGNSNSITTRQTGAGHYNETTISGNSNVVNLQQTGSGSKTLFTNVNGANNAVTATQQGTGQHYLDINLLGNGHTVNALQDGIGNHAATIKLNNTGGSSTVNMNQLGTTAQTYSIDQSCTNPAGCNTTITQGQ
jgi:hypothetical protein